LSNFVLAPCWADPPFYRLHVDEQFDNINQLVGLLDAELSAMNMEYGSKRSSGRLGPIVVNHLPPGTLGEVDADRQRRYGASNEQYKHQYLYTRPGDDASLTPRGAGESRRLGSPTS
jgi:hypothetical protein